MPTSPTPAPRLGRSQQWGPKICPPAIHPSNNALSRWRRVPQCMENAERPDQVRPPRCVMGDPSRCELGNGGCRWASRVSRPARPRWPVEIGYAIDPLYRRQGYAKAALRILLDMATNDPLVKVVRATVRPDNLSSRNLIAKHGFHEIGEQWDEEDGLEVILEVSVS
ncbi:GNAT family N-acetyltransferase [Phialemonium atrogriseum]|uniref:GNAT family N-acetyltransferase n=1 Tax=Phialemonium atrogriseum TaxID=1093897 RepID=A0AAJ0C8G4_9PEZI|nr:GNAT family N-acetyltransferase [Phialemonium atrogriseum]KAK1772085.1 GNAT family N-acetyltransferase [Phialemonium atrogriseum]